MGLHYLCILSDNAVSRAILSSPWLYMLYGALTAGIFEECGRFCMYKTVMRRYDGRAAAVTAGIGHGGIEAMTVSAASMALYLVFALCWNAGDTDALLKLAGSAETAQTVAASLGNQPNEHQPNGKQSEPQTGSRKKSFDELFHIGRLPKNKIPTLS